MITVDLALKAMISSHFPDVELTLYTTEGDHIMPAAAPYGSCQYVHFNNWQQLIEYDCIIFWGDFLHARSYMKDVRGRISRSRPEIDSKEVDIKAREIASLLFLEGAPSSLLNKVVCFGN